MRLLLSTARAAKVSPLLDREIEETCAGLATSFARHLCSIGENNSATIVQYISTMKSEVNPSDSYRKDTIEVLCRLSEFHDMLFRYKIRKNPKEFLKSLSFYSRYNIPGASRTLT
jgi:hypothetical protein